MPEFTEEEIQQCLASGLEYAKECLRVHGAVQPHFFLISPDRYMLAVPCEWKNDEQKHSQFRLIRVACKLLPTIAVGFVSEAWTLQASGDPAQQVRPSESPNRIEVVQVMVETPGNLHHHSYAMVRDSQGHPSLSDELMRWKMGIGKKSAEGEEFMGDMVFLPENVAAVRSIPGVEGVGVQHGD